MKNIFPAIAIIVLITLSGCNTSKNKALHQIKILSYQLDSLDAVYQNIDWEHWSQLNDSINNQITIISNQPEIALKLDSSFVTYFGPFSTAGKILSRVFRKSKSQLSEELTFSKKQLENLSKDIKAKLINDSDSIYIYIGQEQKAIQELIFNVNSLESTLNEQQEAYEATISQVEELALKIKSLKPTFGKSSDEIHYNEEQEQD